VSFGFDWSLIWTWRANDAGEQVSREQMSGEQLSLGSNCHWGASVAGASVRGANVRGANVAGAIVWGAPFGIPFYCRFSFGDLFVNESLIRELLLRFLELGFCFNRTFLRCLCSE